MKQDKNIAVEFNEFSKNYTQDMMCCVPHYTELISCFGKYLPNDFNPKSILDLGCGNGNITAQLLTYFPNATYTLVDASSEMISLCQSQFKGYDINFSNTYFNDFEFHEDGFDLIAAGFSLHHCERQEKQLLFNAIHSSLKKDGIFAYSDLMISKTNPDHPMLLENWHRFVNNNYSDDEKWAWLMEHYAAYDQPEDFLLQIEWIKNAGFTTVKIPFREDHWVYIQAMK